MNKKIINTLCFSLLVGCAPIPMDNEVLNKNNISYTLDSYQNYQKLFKGNIGENIKSNRKYDTRKYECLGSSLFAFGLTLPYCFTLEEKKDYTTLAETNSLECLYLEENSDECIIYRRNHKKEDSKVNFFDYKRFLPKNSNIKTDEDFLHLFKIYNKNKEEEQACYNEIQSNTLSYYEKQEKYKYCLKKDETIEKILKDYIYDGILKEKKQEKEQEIAQQKKEKSYIEDCKNAEKKAEEYMKSIPSEGFMILEYTHVVDLAKDGVFVEGPYGGLRVFVYTKDTEYATGESFRSNGVFYKQNGYYKYTTITGATNSVVAFVPTKYKVDKADYEYYLKNKDLTCKEDFIFYKENGEEKRIERKD